MPLAYAKLRPLPATPASPHWNDVLRDRLAALHREAEREARAGHPGTEPRGAIVARKLAAFRDELPDLRRDHRRRSAGTDELLHAIALLARDDAAPDALIA